MHVNARHLLEGCREVLARHDAPMPLQQRMQLLRGGGTPQFGSQLSSLIASPVAVSGAAVLLN